MAIAHTVITETNEFPDVSYHSWSPDEEALVKAAAKFGYFLTSSSDRTYVVRILDQAEPTFYDVIGVNEFTSERRMMSIVV